MNCKVRQLDIMIFVLYLSLFKIGITSQSIQQLIRLGMLLILWGFIFFDFRINKAKNYMITIPFCLCILCSSFFGYLFNYVGIQSIFNSILYAISIYTIYYVIQLCNKNSYEFEMIDSLFKINSIYCIGSLLSMVIMGHSDNGTEITYLFGNKFVTSYFFIFWNVLYLIKYEQNIKNSKKYRNIYFLTSFVTILICKWLYCSTAMLASLFLIIIYFVSANIKSLLKETKVIILFMILMALIPFMISFIVKLDFVKYIVVEVLHKNINLTGRTAIYSNLSRIIRNSPLLGYGYGNRAVHEFVGYGNAQNGLVQIVVDYGMIGATFFMLLVYKCIKNIGNERKQKLLVMFYILVICSIVEITYSYMFFIVIFMILCLDLSGDTNERKI